VSILENPRFTCASALTQQLPILDRLVPTPHLRNNRQPPRLNRLHSPPPLSDSPSSFILSTDSSDNDNHAYIHPKPIMSTLATVEPTSGKAPVLTTGDLTPAVAMDFENAAQDFFVAKSVPLDKQVSLILPGIKDIRIRDWITANRARITSLSFVDFIKELRENYLQSDWRTKFATRFSHPHSLRLVNHFGIGPKSFCPSTASSVILHLFLTILPSAIISKLIWMMN